MINPRRQFGNEGEEHAATYLKKNGLRVIDRQWTCSFGEIDLVCKEKDEWVFVEVKSRRSDAYGYPEESVNASKRKHLLACAEAYLSLHHCEQDSWRVDVVAIEFAYTPPRVVHIVAIDE